MKAGLSSSCLLLLLIENVLFKIQEELTTEISVGYGLAIMQGEGFATGKH